MGVAEDKFRFAAVERGDEPADGVGRHAERIEVKRAVVETIAEPALDTVLPVLRVAPGFGDPPAAVPTGPFVRSQCAGSLPREAAGVEADGERHAGRAGGRLPD